jgi:hypothetical protein
MDDGTQVFILGCDGVCPSELIIPETLTATGDHPVTTIIESAFQEKMITSLELPESLVTIEPRAFYGNYSLSTITFGEGDNLQTIGAQAFQSNSATTITIPASVMSVGDCAFMNSVTTAINVAPLGSPMLTSVDGILLAESGTQLIQYPGGRANQYIPDGVTHIHYCAFYGNPLITAITFPASVKHISENAFTAAELTDATFLGDAPTIEYGAFAFVPTSMKVHFPTKAKGWGVEKTTGELSQFIFDKFAAPKYVTPTRIRGMLKVTKTLRANVGTWKSELPLTYTYQWYTCNKKAAVGSHLTNPAKACVKIKSAVSARYKLKKDQQNKFIGLLVTASNSDFSSKVFVSTSVRIKKV